MARHYGAFASNWEAIKVGFAATTTLSEAPFGHLLITHPSKQFFQQVLHQGQVHLQVNPHYLAPLQRVLANTDAVYLLLGGNEHNSLFFQTHVQPFDFFHPHYPEALLPGRQLVPLETLREHLRRTLSIVGVQLQLLNPLLDGHKTVFVPPPPPIPSVAHIIAHAEGFDFSHAPVEEASVRLKIFALYMEELCALCDRNGVALHTPEAQTRDASGFLAQEYWGNATHAAPAYYAGLLAAC
jgi:hypothetical protein